MVAQIEDQNLCSISSTHPNCSFHNTTNLYPPHLTCHHTQQTTTDITILISHHCEPAKPNQHLYYPVNTTSNSIPHNSILATLQIAAKSITPNSRNLNKHSQFTYHFLLARQRALYTQPLVSMYCRVILCTCPPLGKHHPHTPFWEHFFWDQYWCHVQYIGPILWSHLHTLFCQWMFMYPRGWGDIWKALLCKIHSLWPTCPSSKLIFCAPFARMSGWWNW